MFVVYNEIMKTIKLTLAQRDALEKIRIIHAMWVKRFYAEIFPDVKDMQPTPTPTSWTSEVELRYTHKMRRDTLEALVKKGYLERRRTDGWGNEVRIVEQTGGK